MEDDGEGGEGEPRQDQSDHARTLRFTPARLALYRRRVQRLIDSGAPLSSRVVRVSVSPVTSQ